MIPSLGRIVHQSGAELVPAVEPVKVVQPFPTLVDKPDQIVVPPREWGTLVNTPEPQRLAA